MECPVCGKNHDPGDRFCSSCGTPLGEEQPRGRFRPLFQKTGDSTSVWVDYVRPFVTAALFFCLGLLALAGVAFLVDRFLLSN
jgi:hypothetical protein